MKYIVLPGAAFILLWVGAGLYFGGNAQWKGIDETIVGKVAEEAGRPPADPLINMAQGDLLLFAFLIAGAVGGFFLGFYFRQLFYSDTSKD